MNDVRRKMLVQHEQKLTKLCWTERVGRILLSSSRCRIPKDAHLSASSLMEPSTDILDIHGMQEWNDHRGIREREREGRGSMSESWKGGWSIVSRAASINYAPESCGGILWRSQFIEAPWEGLPFGTRLKRGYTGLFIPSVNSFGISIFLINGAILKSFNVARAHMVRIFLMHINPW